MIAERPVENVVRLKEDDSKPHRYLSLEEIQVLRLVADSLDRGENEETIDLPPKVVPAAMLGLR